MSRCTRKKKLPIRQNIEQLEDRAAPTSFRSIDGTGNNQAHPEWGSTGEALLRVGPVRYADGISTPAPQGGVGRPGPRVISNTIVDAAGDNPDDERSLAAMIYAWGQFIDHDMDLTTNASPREPFNIPVPAGDPQFDPAGTGTQIIPFSRSNSVPGTGTSTSNPRQQPNQITSFIDGSMVYGSDAVTATKLRTGTGGLLKTSPGETGDLLPVNNLATFPTGTLPMGNDAHRVPDDQLFAAGDIRANENIELTSLHTLFVREHNFWANRIAAQNPGMSDEGIYQRARAIVGAELQVITYKEWIPAILGPNAMSAYTGYKPGVNPGIANEFSTALFRLGHSLLGEDVEFLDNRGIPVAEEVPLNEAFSNPPLIEEGGGIGPILKYLASDPSSKLDNKIVDQVRNFLFGEPGQGGFDLSTLNIQRGRDHGIANYNDVRAAYGLPRVTRFDQISSNPEIQAKLQQLYGNVNNIDLWVGALAEDHVGGGSTGRLIRAGLIDQFTRLRDGDSFWYQRQFSGAQLRQLENTTLSQIIARNTTTTNLQDNAFFFKASVSGKVFNDANGNGVRNFGEDGLRGVTVVLFNTTEDPDGEGLARVRTDSNGNYRFDNFDGLLVGNYRVDVVVPSGFRATTDDDVNFSSTKGDTHRTVNFGLKRSGFGAASNSTSGVNAPESGGALLFLAPASAAPSGSIGLSASPASPLPAILLQPTLPPAGATGTSSTKTTDTEGDRLVLLPPPSDPAPDLFGLDPMKV